MQISFNPSWEYSNIMDENEFAQNLANGEQVFFLNMCKLQCVHWGRLTYFCLFNGPRRSLEVQEGGKISRTLGLLLNC